MPANTVNRYVALLGAAFLTRWIPAWSTNLTTRAVSTPKNVFADAGLAAHLAGMTPRRLRVLGVPVGPLAENVVRGELARRITWAQEPVLLHRDGARRGLPWCPAPGSTAG